MRIIWPAPALSQTPAAWNSLYRKAPYFGVASPEPITCNPFWETYNLAVPKEKQHRAFLLFLPAKKSWWTPNNRHSFIFQVELQSILNVPLHLLPILISLIRSKAPFPPSGLFQRFRPLGKTAWGSISVHACGEMSCLVELGAWWQGHSFIGTYVGTQSLLTLGEH